MHDRRIARVITPGTLIDENFMDPYANNYVMAVYLSDTQVLDQEIAPAEDHNIVSGPSPAIGDLSVGLAWLDLSTGHFFTQETTVASLGSILSRVGPREVVLDKELQSQTGHHLFSILTEDRHLVTYAPRGQMHSLDDWAPLLESAVPTQTAGEFTADEVRAGSLLLHYVKDRLQGLSMKLQPPQRYESMDVMNIDKHSMRSLEIKQTIRDGAFRGSLLHAIRRTVTKSGARLLNDWLSKF
jgi:DNA mismatch repair ATPase MutS